MMSHASWAVNLQVVHHVPRLDPLEQPEVAEVAVLRRAQSKLHNRWAQRLAKKKAEVWLVRLVEPSAVLEKLWQVPKAAIFIPAGNQHPINLY
jgi:hypothetical protein